MKLKLKSKGFKDKDLEIKRKKICNQPMLICKTKYIDSKMF